jgi:hypothetical protein
MYGNADKWRQWLDFKTLSRNLDRNSEEKEPKLNQPQVLELHIYAITRIDFRIFMFLLVPRYEKWGKNVKSGDVA